MTRVTAHTNPGCPAARRALEGSSARKGYRGGAVCSLPRDGRQDPTTLGLLDAKAIRAIQFGGWNAVNWGTGREGSGASR